MPDLEEIYRERLADRFFIVYAHSIKSRNRRKTEYCEIPVYFGEKNGKHLIGADSDFAKEKASAFLSMSNFIHFPNMAGNFNDNTSDLNNPEILIGNENYCFGFIEEDDGIYVPITCLDTDMRDRCYAPLYTIDDIVEVTEKEAVDVASKQAGTILMK